MVDNLLEKDPKQIKRFFKLFEDLKKKYKLDKIPTFDK